MIERAVEAGVSTTVVCQLTLSARIVDWQRIAHGELELKRALASKRLRLDGAAIWPLRHVAVFARCLQLIAEVPTD